MSEVQFVYIAMAIDPAGSQCIEYAYRRVNACAFMILPYLFSEAL